MEGQGAAHELAPGFYDDADKAKFVSYFTKPKKRGRPKKRRRGRPKKKKPTDDESAASAQCMIDMTRKVEPNLDARLEAQVLASRAACSDAKTRRVNWDIEPHSSLRNRVADSWINKNDLYTKGDTFYKFCARTNFSRSTLTRYLPLRRKFLQDGVAPQPKKRGRKTHLCESVMRHICEGLFASFLAKLLSRTHTHIDSCKAPRRSK